MDVVLGRHYDNQFQVPLLFLLTCSVLMHAGVQDGLTQGLAWLFVASRLAHSWVHLRGNVVVRRLQAYALGWFTIVALWIRLLLAA
ncbi:MAPEG family protein [Nevskia sp.]|uniref:MAPEG family protein n=1 Tax=Nevskia sp. TaxID=1929292 RepID=UPI00345B1453